MQVGDARLQFCLLSSRLPMTNAKELSRLRLLVMGTGPFAVPMFARILEAGDHKVLGVGSASRLRVPAGADVRTYTLTEYSNLYSVAVAGGPGTAVRIFCAHLWRRRSLFCWWRYIRDE